MEHQANLPKSSYSNAETEAGIPNVAKAYGFLSTLVYLEKETPYKRDELTKWTVFAFHKNLRYLSNHAAALKRYNEIMEQSISKKG